MNGFRRLVMVLTLGAFGGIFVFSLNPVNSTLLRLGFLTCLFGVWAGFLGLVWARKFVRIAVMLLPLVAGVPFLLPGKEIDREALRLDYVRRVVAFQGTDYFWGGESSRGIDCSGLPRRALRDAMLFEGVRNLNGSGFRGWLEHWWHDASAKALAEGYRGYAFPLEIEGTIREMSYNHLEPGDLAVTADGVHILVYGGDGIWIQADPGLDLVAALNGREDENPWFRAPVSMHRWSVFETR